MIGRLYLPIASCTRRTSSTAAFVWSGISTSSRRSSIPKYCDVTTTSFLAQQHQRHHQQVRFHRTNYDGPGKFDERETGTKAFEEAARGHDNNEHHDHSHHHHELDNSNANDSAKDAVVEAESKEQIQQLLQARYIRRSGSYARRGYTIGIGGPVGSGKTALTLALCRELRDKVQLGVVTNDIFTQEDSEFLARNNALAKGRIMPVETGGCPHAAIREDNSIRSERAAAAEQQQQNDDNSGGGTGSIAQEPLLLCESGGDNLAANFSSELADYTIYVIDVAGGDKVPRKGGPGISQSDLLVINKIDLAEAVGASLEVMERDANKMRQGRVQGGESGPVVFASVKNGVGVDQIISHIMRGFEDAHRLVQSAS
ncbi:hypothetical protein ACHAWU_005749 [Discostella pseudostelligera]|uniref:CobW/HypB/UreG nucleotide-binding domain-containing protein n=1 Tax=Discostella pseudostelligera TaxID=259834 RepID=A0ABD3LZ34_9STRA